MRLALQRGHIPQQGGRYEVSTVAAIEPHVYDRLCKLGFQVQRFGADIPYGQTHEAALALHTDDGNDNKDGTNTLSGWSMGYWEAMHPGSQTLAGYIGSTYGKACSIRHGRDNYTGGLHYYYANRRFIPTTKFVIIEMGFACNPAERDYLLANAAKLGKALANGIGYYFGTEEAEVSTSSSRVSTGARTKLAEGYAHIGKNGNLTEGCWLHISQFDADMAHATVSVISNTAAKSKTYDLPRNKDLNLNLEGFGIAGPVLWRVSTDVAAVVGADNRVWS